MVVGVLDQPRHAVDRALPRKAVADAIVGVADDAVLTIGVVGDALFHQAIVIVVHIVDGAACARRVGVFFHHARAITRLIERVDVVADDRHVGAPVGEPRETIESIVLVACHRTVGVFHARAIAVGVVTIVRDSRRASGIANAIGIVIFHANESIEAIEAISRVGELAIG